MSSASNERRAHVRDPSRAPVRRLRFGAALLFERGRTHRYGPDRSQCADLHLPSGAGPHPLVVLIHGGSWYKRHGKIVMRALARDLRASGFAVWNIEYRRVGNGGGWPSTLSDVAAAIDYVGRLQAPLDLSRASVVGHSAGGQLALWAASRVREQWDARAESGERERAEPLRLRHAVALAGVCDLAGAYRLWRGGAVRAFIGGSPDEVPERFAVADPIALLPLGVPALLVHGTSDETVSVRLSRSYARAARAAGDSVELIEIEGVDGGHRAHVDPRAGAWPAVVDWLQAAARVPEAEGAATR
jgi:acetyl esterase/lipase